MLESELFGYAEGAFTGAKRGGKMGLFEAAAGGTLFLDEISEMGHRAPGQAAPRPPGAAVPPGGRGQGAGGRRAGDRRLQRLLPDYVAEGKFGRICTTASTPLPCTSRPCGSGPGDIPLLARTILDELGHRLRRPFTLTDDAVECLQAHDWPGNVRELRNALEFSAYLTPSG